jgi:sensor histidine kinase YesM
MIRKKIFSILKNLLIIIGAGFLISYLINGSIKIILDFFWPVVIYSIIIGTSLWQGIKLIIISLGKIKKFQQKPFMSFAISTLAICIYSVIVIYAMDIGWSMLVGGYSFSEIEVPSFFYFVIIVVVTIIISFANYIKEFIIDKQKSELREEKLKNEIIKLEYETLKNQVNPHFLFNSLNALTSLVADNEDAVKFIKNLSDVYRYVIEHKDKELVELVNELAFARSYLYLHQIRFGKNLICNVCEAPSKKMIVPLAVQMLVENAIKHNEVSEDSALKISIFIEDNFLVVENNLQLKSTMNDSSKIGLSNIKSRYAYLTDIEVISGSFGDKFIVKLPLLDMNNIENHAEKHLS